MRINDDKISSPSMVYRKLVYTNRRTGHNQPKLALFAAKDIAPYTEIVL